jgi:signal transduction histidine kinase
MMNQNNKERILIIDDEEEVRFSLQTLLERRGYATRTADNGKAALEILCKDKFDLVVLDIKMPGIGGISVLEKIRQSEGEEVTAEARMPIIILTGFADEGTAIKAMRLKADDYILKPFDVDQFIYVIEKCLRVKMLEKERLSYNKKLEQMVEERTRNLEKAQSQIIQSAKMTAVGQLGAGVAHELNNPLGGVLGYAQLIIETFKQSQNDPEKLGQCKAYAEFIEREALRCKKIVENLLNFSRKPKSEKLDCQGVNEALQETLSVCGNQLKLKQIKVIVNIDPDLRDVMCIKNQVQQVFANLILNAQQAMEEGGTLKIKAFNVVEREQTVNKIKIQFIDQGKGIAKENLKKIFDPFFTTKTTTNGTGLGLSVSYQIIRAHDGTIEVESEEGKGTTFSIVLPVMKDSPHGAAPSSGGPGGKA